MPPDEFPTGRSLLRDDVFERLRDAIVDGAYEPGEQLRDGELAERLGVSRTPVREALLRLGEVGLVVASPSRSTVVSEVDSVAVREAREVVAAMHGIAVRQSVGRLTEADLEEMRAANARFAAAVRADDPDAALAADHDLHGVPVRVSGNRAALAVLEQYTPVLRRAEKLCFATEAGLESIAVHDALIAACAARDDLRAALLTYETWHTLSDEPCPPGSSRMA